MRRTLSDVGDYIVGWQKIYACGFYVEDLLNLVKNENIDIWDLQKTDQCTITFKIHSFSSERLFEIAENSQHLREMELKISESGGLLDDILRYKLRSGIFVGVLFSIVVFVVMTSFIWKIEISGLFSVPERVLLESLAANGIYVGALTTGHDLQQIKYNVMHDYENIAYITINIKGCKAEIEVDESIIPPELQDPEPCNIFAERDGQIVLIETYQGLPQVTKYNAVRKGDLLVSGVYNSKVIGYRLVHADAKIMARTRRTYTEFCPFSYVELETTGNTDVFYKLNIFGLSIDLSFFNNVNYEFYDSVSEETELCIGEDLVLPISVVKTVLYEQAERQVSCDEEIATAIVVAKLDERLRIDLHGLETETFEESFVIGDDGVYGTYDLTVIEDICEERKIEVEIID